MYTLAVGSTLYNISDINHCEQIIKKPNFPIQLTHWMVLGPLEQLIALMSVSGESCFWVLRLQDIF